MRRTMEAGFLNAVANHPEVRPWIGGVGPLDLQPMISNLANVALTFEAGGWVFARHEAGIYELHTLILPEGRGRRAREAWREAERYMFARTDAREIVTRVPAHNRGAALAARMCGFRERFRRVGAFRTAEGEMVDVSYQALTIDDWAGRDTEALRAGEVFHAQIEVAKLVADSALPDHPEDAAHDQAAGAACLMIAQGNARKGAWFYNRWARLAGYQGVAIVSENPLVINVGVGVMVEVSEGKMEVIRCP